MAACTAITAFAPSIFAKSIFAPRRANKSVEAEAAPISIMNAGVAAVQVGKICEGINAIAQEGKTVATPAAKGLTNVQNLTSSGNSIFSDVKKAVNFGLKHANVNGMIGGVALLNALYDDNKEKAFIQNGGMFLSMLCGEGAYKYLFGSSDSSRENGVNKIKVDEGYLYENSEKYRNFVDKFADLCEKQEAALKDCGEVKKFVGKMFKYAPPAAKGFGFAFVSVGTSALGYWGFGKLADKVLDQKAS